MAKCLGQKTRTALIAVAVVASGCGMLGTPAVAKKVNIKWFGTGAGTAAMWNDVIKMYQKEHPGVTITVISGDMDKFYTMITAGLMPDVWGPYSTPGIKADVNRNWAADMTPYIQRDAKEMDLQDFYPGMMQKFRVNGRQYALPFINWEDFLFYNPVMYAEAGLNPPPVDSGDKSWNWDRMVANAQKLTKLNSSGKIVVAGLDFERTITHNAAYLQMWDAHPYSEEALRSAVPQKVDWDSPQAVKAFTKVHELIYKLGVTTPAPLTMEGGKLAQLFNSGWHIQYLPPVKKAKWAIANLPWAVTNTGTMWPDGWRMSRISKNKEEVWDFVKYLCSKRVLSYISSAPGSPFQVIPSARKSVFADSLGANIAALTGMKASDVVRITEQADAVNVVKYHDTICIHADLCEKFLDPIISDLWANKLSPSQAAAKLQAVTDRQLPLLFNRWVRNIKFTGKEPK